MVYVAKSSQQGGAAKEALRERTIWSALPLAGCWVRAPDGPCGADGGGGADGTDGGAWNSSKVAQCSFPASRSQLSELVRST